MNKEISRAVIALGVLLAIGMSSAAFIFGMQAKQIGAAGRQSIAVKGLAEKSIKADYVEWSIGARVYGQTFAEALAKLRAERPALNKFLENQGFDASALKVANESVSPNMVEEDANNNRGTRQVQKGFVANQSIVVTTKDLAKVQTANKAALQLEAEGHPVYYSDPLYLVSNLEDIKMSLIGAATENAHKRAEEFAKVGNVKAGAMRSASQGAFYILAAGASVEASDYGGTYDKTTADKIARVVVTIEYGIER